MTILFMTLASDCKQFLQVHSSYLKKLVCLLDIIFKKLHNVKICDLKALRADNNLFEYFKLKYFNFLASNKFEKAFYYDYLKCQHNP